MTHKFLLPEITFTTSRSGGPGGQHVNKVSSRVTLRFDIGRSRLLGPRHKEILRTKLKSRITREGVLILSAQEHRSQLKNKAAVLLKLDKILQRAFQQKKIRKATSPSGAAKRHRIEGKKKLGEKKALRRRIHPPSDV